MVPLVDSHILSESLWLDGFESQLVQTIPKNNGIMIKTNKCFNNICLYADGKTNG